jgi:hypothetical protein
MMLNIEGYKKFVRKCRKQATYIVRQNKIRCLNP